jgi:hypothetical protein
VAVVGAAAAAEHGDVGQPLAQRDEAGTELLGIALVELLRLMAVSWPI